MYTFYDPLSAYTYIYTSIYYLILTPFNSETFITHTRADLEMPATQAYINADTLDIVCPYCF